jgi:hypothetical protein
MSHASQALDSAAANHGILKASVLFQTFQRFNAIRQVLHRFGIL